MSRWERTSAGKWRLVPGDPTPEEAAAGAERLREMSGARCPPRASLWNPESTVAAVGRPVESRGEWERILAKKGWIETGGRSASTNTPTITPTRKPHGEMIRDVVDEAEKFLHETGQWVPPGTPTTERTKQLIAQGLSPVKLPDPVASKGKAEPVLTHVPQGDVHLIQQGPRYSKDNPWGYTGGRDEIIAAAMPTLRRG